MMISRRLVCGSVVAVLLFLSGYGFGYQTKTEEGRLAAYQKELVQERKNIVEAREELRRQARASTLDIIPAKIDYLRAVLEISRKEGEVRDTLKEMDRLCGDWLQVAEHMKSIAKLSPDAYLEMKVKILTILIEIEQRRLKLKAN